MIQEVWVGIADNTNSCHMLINVSFTQLGRHNCNFAYITTMIPQYL